MWFLNGKKCAVYLKQIIYGTCSPSLGNVTQNVKIFKMTFQIHEPEISFKTNNLQQGPWCVVKINTQKFVGCGKFMMTIFNTQRKCLKKRKLFKI